MSIFLITFQMSSEARNNEMIKAIKMDGPWARITDTTWCVKAENTTTSEIRDKLNNRVQLNNTEKLFVVNITNSAWASYYLPKEVADWLKE